MPVAAHPAVTPTRIKVIRCKDFPCTFYNNSDILHSMSLSNKAVAHTTIIITILTVAGKCLGLIRESMLARTFGTTYVTDAYVVSQSVSIILVEVIIVGFLAGMMPVYQKIKLDDNPEKIKYFMGNLYSVTTVGVIVISVGTVVLADVLIFIFAPKFSTEAHDLSTMLTRILAISVVFNLINRVQTQQLKAENSFLPTTLTSFILNISIISALVFIAPIYGIAGVTWASVFAAVVTCILLRLFVHRIGYKFKPHFNLKDDGLKQVGKLGLPIILGSSVLSVNTVVDRNLASGLAEGSIAALSFSNKLSTFISGVISMGMGAICYTKMAQLVAKGNVEEFKNFLRYIFNSLLVIVIPATVGMIVLASPAVELVFEYGAFDVTSKEMTAYALTFYTIGLAGVIFREMTTYGLYSLEDTKSPLINSVISIGINIVLNIILVQFMGIGGLALATSISSLIGALLMVISLRKRIGRLGLKSVAVTFIKVLIASGIMGAVVIIVYPALKAVLIRNSLSFFLTVICGVIVYSVIIYFMRINEVNKMLALITSKASKLFSRS